MKLSYKPRPLKEIYEDVKNTGISFDDLKNTLNSMADKGVIGEGERNGVQCFFNIPLIVGMYEGQLYGLTRELLKDFDEYTGTRGFGLEFLSSELPQMRTIPVERSIKVEHQVATYDQLTNLIDKSDGPFVIHECICRKASGLKGSPCRKTSRLETCMALGEAATHSLKVRKKSDQRGSPFHHPAKSDGWVGTAALQLAEGGIYLCLLWMLLRNASRSKDAAKTRRFLGLQLLCNGRRRGLHGLWDLCGKMPSESRSFK